MSREDATLHVAHCIVGLAVGGKRNAADTRRGWSITDPRSYVATWRWAQALRTDHKV